MERERDQKIMERTWVLTERIHLKRTESTETWLTPAAPNHIGGLDFCNFPGCSDLFCLGMVNTFIFI